MSTKCTVLSEKSYHFYWDYATNKYELSIQEQGGMGNFIQKVGKLLEGCNKSDVGVYIFDLKKGGVKKWKSSPYKGCCQHECCRRKK